jgi:acetylornithine/N-succinyldiaminopimelate aminotransferase
MGRTGKLWAFENYNISPDLLTVAKGLGGGLPIGAMVAAESCKNLFQPGDHASTFGGGPVVCAAALAVWEIINENGFLAEVTRKGYKLKAQLEKIVHDMPDLTGEYRGLGLNLCP